MKQMGTILDVIRKGIEVADAQNQFVIVFRIRYITYEAVAENDTHNVGDCVCFSEDDEVLEKIIDDSMCYVSNSETVAVMKGDYKGAFVRYDDVYHTIWFDLDDTQDVGRLCDIAFMLDQNEAWESFNSHTTFTN